MRALTRLWRDERGFGNHANTELMIIVAFFGILAAIAIPKFADLIRASNEGASKGNLGALRSSLSIFYGDNEGRYPLHPALLTVERKDVKYIGEIPPAKAPNYHDDSSRIRLAAEPDDIDDSGGWLYVFDPESPSYGTVLVNCSHTDSKGIAWTSY